MKTYHYFKADDCSMCKTVDPFVRQLDQTKHFFVKVHNVSKEQNFANAMGVRMLPTLILENKEAVFVGGQVLPELNRILNEIKKFKCVI